MPRKALPTLISLLAALATSSAAHAQTLGGPLTLPPWNDEAGFDDPSQYATIQAADVDGDGRDELIARQHYGVEAWEFERSAGQWTPLPGTVPLRDANNWNNPTYSATIQMADVERNGRSAVMYRGSGGISFATYDTAARGWRPAYGAPITTLSDDIQGGKWLQRDAFGTIQTADLVDDSTLELVGRAADGVHVWSYDGTGWTQRADVLALTDAVGFDQPESWFTIHAADFDGDGKDELMARWPAGVSIYRLTPAGHWVGSAGPPLRDSDGWNNPTAYETLRPADLDGDGKDEIVGLLPGAGVLAFKRRPDGRWQNWSAPLDLTDPVWTRPDRSGTFQTADVLPGDPGEEVLIRGADGILIYALHADGTWAPAVAGPPLSDGAGFTREERWQTIQTAEIDGRPGREIVARDGAGIRTFERAADGTWRPPSASFPDYTSASAPAALKAAYAAIPAALNDPARIPLNRPCAPGESPATGCVRDVRTDFYPNKERADLDQAYTNLKGAPTPAGVDPGAFDQVRKQVLSELDASADVTQHAADMRTFYTETVQSKEFTVELVVDQMKDFAAEGEFTEDAATVLEDVIEAVAFVGPGEALGLEPPLEGLALLISLGSESGKVFGLEDPIKAALPNLQAQLADRLGKSLDGTTANKNAALADWGLLQTWGNLVENGRYAVDTTGDAYERAVAKSLRAYTIWLWKTLSLGAFFIDFSGGYGKYQWGRYTVTFIDGEPADGPFTTVFEATSEACLKVFLTDCDLGVPMSDVFLGRNGWHLGCPDGCPSSLSLSATPSPHRNRAIADLHGSALRAGRPTHLFLGPFDTAARRVRSVRFVLDGRTLSVRRRAPFDVVGTRPARHACRTCARRPAHPLSPALLGPGRHRLAAVVRRRRGGRERIVASFRVKGGRAHALRFSEAGRRAGRLLRRATLAPGAHVFFGPVRGNAEGVKAVKFRLDGRSAGVDRRPPFELGRRPGPGPHRLRAEVVLRGGHARLVREARFTVAPR